MESQPATCPECGMDLTGKDILGHAADHWNHDADRQKMGKEAKERRAELGKLSGRPREEWPWEM